MNRRLVLKAAVAMVALVGVTGHTPYRQWQVYRRRHLLILTSKSEAPSYPLGKQVAEILALYLPASKAGVARAPNSERIASLIGSKQMDVALLERTAAAALLEGEAPFEQPLPLRALVGLGDYLLVCREDFPADHAYLLTRTLSMHRDLLSVPVTPAVGGEGRADARVPTHAGAFSYYAGHPPPAADVETLVAE